MGPEMDAESAAKYYSGNLKSLRIRFRISAVLSAALIWISFGLPVAGLLKTSPTALALFCLILELSVIMLGLDIFTAGMMSLVRMKPSLWSLVAISCFTAALDAAVTAALGSSIEGLHFCGVAAGSMTFALSAPCKPPAGSGSPCGPGPQPRPLRRHLRSPSFRGRNDAFKIETRTAGYLAAARSLIWPRARTEPCGISSAAALVLSVVAAALSKEWNYFFRILAAVTAPCAPLRLPLLPLPIRSSPAGFSCRLRDRRLGGASDIGSAKHLIITDCDVFPAGTLSVESVRILAGPGREGYLPAWEALSALPAAASPRFLPI
jgi:hypothetical protein